MIIWNINNLVIYLPAHMTNIIQVSDSLCWCRVDFSSSTSMKSLVISALTDLPQQLSLNSSSQLDSSTFTGVSPADLQQQKTRATIKRILCITSVFSMLIIIKLLVSFFSADSRCGSETCNRCLHATETFI